MPAARKFASTFCREPYECSRHGLWLTWEPFHWLHRKSFNMYPSGVYLVYEYNFMTMAEILINHFHHRIRNILMYHCHVCPATWTRITSNYYIFRNSQSGSTINPKITTLVKPTWYPSLPITNHGITTRGKPSDNPSVYPIPKLRRSALDNILHLLLTVLH